MRDLGLLQRDLRIDDEFLATAQIE